MFLMQGSVKLFLACLNVVNRGVFCGAVYTWEIVCTLLQVNSVFGM